MSPLTLASGSKSRENPRLRTSFFCVLLLAIAGGSSAAASPCTLEDIYGPTGDSFRAALGFRVFEGDSAYAPETGYGVGVDDMRFVWREYKLIEDATDCATSGPCATVVVDSGQSYGGGSIHIHVLDESPYGAFAPYDRNDCDRNGSYLDAVDDTDCDDDGIPDVALLVSSLPEPAGEPLVANRTSTGVYEAMLPYSWLVNVAGVLLLQDAGPNGTEATVRYEDRWDGSASGNRCQNSANPVTQGFVTEGISIESVTASVVVISHRLVDTSGDADGFPDTNETFDLYLTAANKTNSPLTNVTRTSIRPIRTAVSARRPLASPSSSSPTLATPTRPSGRTRSARRATARGCRASSGSERGSSPRSISRATGGAASASDSSSRPSRSPTPRRSRTCSCGIPRPTMTAGTSTTFA